MIRVTETGLPSAELAAMRKSERGEPLTPDEEERAALAVAVIALDGTSRPSEIPQPTAKDALS